MKIPLKKLKMGFEIPVYGLGTWSMGGGFFRNPFADNKADIAAIRKATDLGVTHIDTAEIYANGHAEKLVAKAIKGVNRKKLFIASKVWPLHFKKKRLVKSCEDSLRRLETDYLDLYYLHAPNPLVPIAETLEALDELVDRGLIKNIAVSNFKKERLVAAQKLTRNKIVANQVHYNLIFREPEATGLLSYCQKNDVILVAWRPVEKGKLAQAGIGILDNICKKYKKTPSAVAINWLISQKNVVTIAKTTNIDHLGENLGGVDWAMQSADIEKLRTEFPNQDEVSDTVSLS